MAIDFSRYDTPTTKKRPTQSGTIDFSQYDAPERATSALSAFGSGAADGLSFGLGDEAMGLVGGSLAALQGRDFGEGNQQWVDASRARQQAAKDDQGGWYMGGQIGGSILPFIGPGFAARGALALSGRAAMGAGARDVALAAARKFALPGVNAAERFAASNGGNITRRVLSGAGLGAGYGTVAGAGHADAEDAGSAVSGGINGAIFGGGLGAVFPAAFGLAGWGKQFLTPTVSKVRGPAPIEDAIFMGVGDPPPPPGSMRPEGAPAAGDFSIEESALDKFLRLVGNSRTSLDDLQNKIGDTLRYDPGRGRTFVDELGVGAEKTMKFLNKSTGETAQRADETFSARNLDAYGRIQREFDDILPAPEMMSRRADARAEFDRLRREDYSTIWKMDVTPEQARAAQGVLTQLGDDPIVVAAVRRAEDIWRRPQVAEGLDAASRGEATALEPLASNPLRQLHYIKRGLDEEAAWRSDPLNPNKFTEEEGASVRLLRGKLRRVLDNLIPGYREANAKWGDESAAVYAMEFGRKLLRGRFNPKAMEELADMTPYEKQHALVGIKEDVLETLRTSDKEGRRNIADALLNTETQKRLRSVLGDDMASRLHHIFTTESRLHRTASYAGARSGSDTGIFGAELMDDAVNIQKPNGPLDAAWQFGRGMLNDITSGVGERRRDAMGKLLLQNTDDPFSADQVREIFKLLRERELARQAAARGAVEGGAGGGMAYTGQQDF